MKTAFGNSLQQTWISPTWIICPKVWSVAHRLSCIIIAASRWAPHYRGSKVPQKKELNQNANKHRANCNQLQLKKSRDFVKPICRDFLNFFVNSQKSCKSLFQMLTMEPTNCHQQHPMKWKGCVTLIAKRSLLYKGFCFSILWCVMTIKPTLAINRIWKEKHHQWHPYGCGEIEKSCLL